MALNSVELAELHGFLARAFPDATVSMADLMEHAGAAGGLLRHVVKQVEGLPKKEWWAGEGDADDAKRNAVTVEAGIIAYLHLLRVEAKLPCSFLENADDGANLATVSGEKEAHKGAAKTLCGLFGAQKVPKLNKKYSLKEWVGRMLTTRVSNAILPAPSPLKQPSVVELPKSASPLRNSTSIPSASPLRSSGAHGDALQKSESSSQFVGENERESVREIGRGAAVVGMDLHLPSVHGTDALWEFLLRPDADRTAPWGSAEQVEKDWAEVLDSDGAAAAQLLRACEIAKSEAGDLHLRLVV